MSLQCVIAKIDADTERDIGTEFEISGFPTIKFFPKGDDKTPIAYEGARTEAGFVEFLNKHCGTHRLVGGGLDDAAGRVPELDVLAIKFMATSDKSARQRIFEQAQTEAKKSSERYIWASLITKSLPCDNALTDFHLRLAWHLITPRSWRRYWRREIPS